VITPLCGLHPLALKKDEPEVVVQALVEGSDICIYIYITLQFDCIKLKMHNVASAVIYRGHAKQWQFARHLPSGSSSTNFCCGSLCVLFARAVMPRVADHSESEESLKDNKKAAPDESSADEDDKEGTPEYEIEEVLDAKRGVFPDVWSTCELCFISIHK